MKNYLRIALDFVPEAEANQPAHEAKPKIESHYLGIGDPVACPVCAEPVPWDPRGYAPCITCAAKDSGLLRQALEMGAVPVTVDEGHVDDDQQ